MIDMWMAGCNVHNLAGLSGRNLKLSGLRATGWCRLVCADQPAGGRRQRLVAELQRERWRRRLAVDTMIRHNPHEAGGEHLTHPEGLVAVQDIDQPVLATLHAGAYWCTAPVAQPDRASDF
jgi:hypothetical protein